MIRDGRRSQLDAEQVVPGDIVELRPGERVPADARLLASRGLEVDEAPLTGESMPVAKRAAPVAADAVVADRVSMTHGGTLVTSGTGTAVVVAHGRADRARAHLGADAAHRGCRDAADAWARRRGAAADRADLRRRGRPARGRARARLSVRRRGAGGGVAGRGGDSRRPAGDRDDRARRRRAADGPPARGDPEAAGGRDARLDDGHLHRQDRHADAEPDDRRELWGDEPALLRAAVLCSDGTGPTELALLEAAAARRDRRGRGTRAGAAARRRSRSTPSASSWPRCTRGRRRVHEGRARGRARALRAPSTGRSTAVEALAGQRHARPRGRREARDDARRRSTAASGCSASRRSSIRRASPRSTAVAPAGRPAST